MPLSNIQPDDSIADRWSDNRLELALSEPLETHVFANQDVQIAIPEIVLCDVRVTGRDIPSEEIILFDERERELLPVEGIRVNFGGSLKIIDVPDYDGSTS